MAEYIDRRTAYSLAKKVCEAVDRNPRVLLPQIILDLIDDVPAADFAPVRHGRWLWRSFNIMCSECDFMPYFDSTEPLYTYCPNCGAKMDEEVDDGRL